MPSPVWEPRRKGVNNAGWRRWTGRAAFFEGLTKWPPKNDSECIYPVQRGGLCCYQPRRRVLNGMPARMRHWAGFRRNDEARSETALRLKAPAVLVPVRLARWRPPAAGVDLLHRTLAVGTKPAGVRRRLAGAARSRLAECGPDDRTAQPVGSRRWSGPETLTCDDDGKRHIKWHWRANNFME